VDQRKPTSIKQVKKDNGMCSIDTGSGTVDYETIRQAMNGEPFTMSLTDQDEIRAVINAVNERIDAHLEACYCPDRGDRYEGGKRKAGKLVLCRTLECIVSVESLPVLLRRLGESDAEAGNQLASDILMVLGIDEYGELVGREAMGLA
jgi:hypothetical protein